MPDWYDILFRIDPIAGRRLPGTPRRSALTASSNSTLGSSRSRGMALHPALSPSNRKPAGDGRCPASGPPRGRASRPSRAARLASFLMASGHRTASHVSVSMTFRDSPAGSVAMPEAYVTAFIPLVSRAAPSVPDLHPPGASAAVARPARPLAPSAAVPAQALASPASDTLPGRTARDLSFALVNTFLPGPRRGPLFSVLLTRTTFGLTIDRVRPPLPRLAALSAAPPC